MARVALVYNLIRPALLREGPLDSIAELDSERTIAAVEMALRDGGHDVVRVEALSDVARRLDAANPDVVFNIAERVSDVPNGESRESLIPALCEVLGLPYTGSGVLATSVCLDKPVSKLVLSRAGIPTPAFVLIDGADQPSVSGLRYPLIVKLAREGSSMGLSEASVVDDEASLRQRVAVLRATYDRPIMVEEFVDGREFTLGVLGNAPLTILPVVEVVFDSPRGINLFELDEPVREMAIAAGRDVPPRGGNHRSICPAQVDAGLAERLRDTAARAYRALGCRDWCRIDMRVDASGTPQVLELNPIAGIDPEYLLPRAARAAGLSYSAFILRILDAALARSTAARASAPIVGSYRAVLGRAASSQMN